MSIKLALIYEAHHCVSWLTVDTVLQYLGPAPALQHRLWTSISGPAAHSASSWRTPGYSCLAKLISGCLSVPDGVSNSPCFTEEQKALHCPPQPTLWAWPPPTDPELTARLFDLVCSGAVSSQLPVPGGKWWSQLSSAEEVCNTLFVQTSPLTRETPKHMYSSQSSPWG